jgi:bacteriorhodopsin
MSYNTVDNNLPIPKKTNDAGEIKTTPSIVVSTDTSKLLTKKTREPTVQYYVKFSFMITYILLLTTATITFIEAMRTNTPNVRHVLNLETCISLVAGYFYSIFIDKIGNSEKNFMQIDWKEITEMRYIDWAITTPFMLIVLSLVVGGHTRIPLHFPTMLLIVALNYFMLYMGYLGETGVLPKITAMLAGFVGFALMFYVIYVTFVQPKYLVANYILFSLYFVIWGLYGFVYLLSEEYKNITMNILDLTAKCFIGLGLWAYYTKIIVA